MIRAIALLLLAVVLGVPAPVSAVDLRGSEGGHHVAQTKRPAPAAPSAATVSKKSPAAEYTPTVRFRLRTELAEGKLAFVGVGGDIEGVVNPTLRVAQGDIGQIGLVNGDG